MKKECIHARHSYTPCYSQASQQLCLEISFSSNSRNLLQFLQCVKEKGGKPDRKPYPLPYGLRNPYRNLKSENSQDYVEKPQRNLTFMNLASGRYVYRVPLCTVILACGLVVITYYNVVELHNFCCHKKK